MVGSEDHTQSPTLTRAAGNCDLQYCEGEIFQIGTASARELFIRCHPQGRGVAGQPAAVQARQLYACLPQVLGRVGAGLGDVVLERLFLRNLTADLAVLRPVRQAAYRAAGVPVEELPLVSYLGQPPCPAHRALELQAYAVVPASDQAVRVVTIPPTDGLPAAKRIEMGGYRHLYANGLAGLPESPPADRTFDEQCDAMFRAGCRLMKSQGSSFQHVLRTWCYLKDIDRDYDPFNTSRNRMFKAEQVHRLPASTGIGARLHPHNNLCSFDLYALLNPEGATIEIMHAATLNEAPEYGSSFSRGMKLGLPDKTILFVSGTASVDEAGATVHHGDSRRQIERHAAERARAADAARRHVCRRRAGHHVSEIGSRLGSLPEDRRRARMGTDTQLHRGRRRLPTGSAVRDRDDRGAARPRFERRTHSAVRALTVGHKEKDTTMTTSAAQPAVPRFRYFVPVFVTLSLATLSIGYLPSVLADEVVAPPQKYHSPQDVAFSPDGSLLAVTDRTSQTLVIIDVTSAQIRRTVALSGPTAGVVWNPNGQTFFVSEYGAGSVAEVNAADGQVLRRMVVDRHPQGLALAARRGRLVVANSTTDRVTVLDLAAGQPVAQIAVPREPYFVAVTPDEKLALVSNLLPAGRANEPGYGAVVSLIDLVDGKHVGDIALPPGSSTVRQVCVASDGKWAYVVHCVGRTSVPSTQLERGWVNTNACSILDLQSRQLYATLLLDQVMVGAADPWGVAVTADGSTLWVSLSGVHQLARIDLARLHAWLAGGLPDDHWLAQPVRDTYNDRSIWLRIKQDGQARRELVNDLGALSQAELIDRRPTGGRGPRGISLSPDGRWLAVAGYFSGDVALFDSSGSSKDPVARIPLGEPIEPDLARRGEMLFHDATYAFQSWLSCATCHPNEARVDGMNWDLLNDGIGNPKNNRSLLLSDRTPPMMSLGIRETMEEAVLKGIYFLRRQPQPEELQALTAYLRSLTPLPSPHLEADGSLSPQATRGREIFLSEQTGCASCHNSPLYTRLQTHDVGTQGSLDRTTSFDTPTLIEVYRTAPYLHDGSAATLREVLTTHNQGNRHGQTSQLTPQELDDLEAFLMSL